MVAIIRKNNEILNIKINQIYLFEQKIILAEIKGGTKRKEKAQLKRLYKKISQLGTNQIVAPPCLIKEKLLKRYHFLETDRKLVLYKMAHAIAQKAKEEIETELIIVYGEQLDLNIKLCASKLCENHKEIGICVGKDTEQLRIALMNEFGISALTHGFQNKKSILICFDPPPETFFQKTKLQGLINLSNKKIVSEIPQIIDIILKKETVSNLENVDQTALASVFLKENSKLINYFEIQTLIYNKEIP